LAQTFDNTYKGFENNDHSNVVRLNIDDTTFEGIYTLEETGCILTSSTAMSQMRGVNKICCI
jgi:hypothetical protein